MTANYCIACSGKGIVSVIGTACKACKGTGLELWPKSFAPKNPSKTKKKVVKSDQSE